MFLCVLLLRGCVLLSLTKLLAEVMGIYEGNGLGLDTVELVFCWIFCICDIFQGGHFGWMGVNDLLMRWSNDLHFQ